MDLRHGFRSPYDKDHDASCRCSWCYLASSDAARYVREEALVEACMNACADVEREEVAAISPFERALYERLTERLMAVMMGACMTKAQMTIVVDEFISAARELAEDAEKAMEKQRELLEEEEVEVEEPLVSVHLVCACCQRDLGPHPLQVTEAEARWLVGSTRCPGCIREGRELP